MSYQPEERYWTDYLRIALPVVGLLLMLGLFWFWAASLIGDDDDDDPGNVASNQPTATIPVPSPSPSPSPGGAAGDANADETATTPAGDGETDTTDGEPSETDPADDANDETSDGQNEEDPDAVEDQADDEREPGEFFEGDAVVTTTDDLRLRSTAEITDDNIVDTLALGAELVVNGEPEEDAEGTVWVPVELGNDPDVIGYVSAQFLELS